MVAREVKRPYKNNQLFSMVYLVTVNLVNLFLQIVGQAWLVRAGQTSPGRDRPGQAGLGQAWPGLVGSGLVGRARGDAGWGRALLGLVGFGGAGLPGPGLAGPGLAGLPIYVMVDYFVPLTVASYDGLFEYLI